MMDVALIAGYVLVSAAMLMTLYRLVRGPALPDRIVALDTLYINAVALLVLVGIHLDSSVFFEAALLIAMMGFAGTVALCKHAMEQNIIE
jgi:multicomponent K+:H+ antiporter subunit F